MDGNRPELSSTPRTVKFIELGQMEDVNGEYDRSYTTEDRTPPLVSDEFIQIEQTREISDLQRLEEEYTHSSSNSYIRYGPHLVHQIPQQYDHVSTSVVLRFCRTRVLRSYYRLLSAVGWRPVLNETNANGGSGAAFMRRLLNVLYSLTAMIFIVAGHVLAYITVYRRDSMDNTRCIGFHSKYTERPGGCSLYIFSVYILPGVLHTTAYAAMLFQMRSQDSEEFTALVERVFLQTTSVWQIARRKIQERLRAVYIAGGLWILLAITGNVINLYYRLKSRRISCTMDDYPIIASLVLGLLMHDVVSMSVAAAYTIHCQLALVYVQNLQQLVRDGKISLLAFYKGVSEATCTIRQVNGLQSTAVFLQTIWLLIRTGASMVGFVQSIDSNNFFRLIVASISTLVWGALLIIPLGQAARLTEACKGVKNLGRELRARPLVYQETSPQELDSLVIFTSSFDLTSELCSIRITKERLTVCCLFFAVGVYGSAHFDLLHF
ncbi:uncharacterized protein LOC100898501 [Galendromus occidentalis]|uniref:Uncharacterized protein LOC100898501 n=1 Tax=Galendromus occidentalis TaxID=34638 RepID=A0AAJ6QRJ7_9ACAR|nr:uncharacterized protein LOC100898501 [Galendromus occidentalis]